MLSEHYLIGFARLTKVLYTDKSSIFKIFNYLHRGLSQIKLHAQIYYSKKPLVFLGDEAEVDSVRPIEIEL